MKVSVNRVSHFNAAHKLHNANWSAKENKEIFGKCANPNYHGHNYKLIVGVKGKVNPETGFVMDMKVLKKLIKKEIEEKLDHKNLNKDVAYFKNLNPTAENIAIYIWSILRKSINKNLELSVTLYETERNFVIYSGE